MLAFLFIFVSMGRLYRKMIQQPETRALLISASLIVVIGVVFYTRVEKWSVLDALYFCVITLGTVGYGDITPTTDLGKIFTIFYIIFGLAVIGGFFATLGQLIRPARFMEHEEAEIAGVLHPGAAREAAETGEDKAGPEDKRQ
jgi:hypothetical protein